MAAEQTTVSVVICAYTLRRWAWLEEAIDSVRDQPVPPTELIVVVDHNENLYDRLRARGDDVQVLRSEQVPGLSGARNTGVLAATGDVIVFLDDDARAAPDWLRTLLGDYDDPTVLAVGGRIEPLWPAGRPRHFPPELDWIVGCSYEGLPHVAAQVRNVIGASMSFRRSVFECAGLFEHGMGRTVRARGAGGEETDLCLRATAAIPGGRVVYDPAAHAAHHVPVERTRMRYMLIRAWGEGASKAVIARRTGPHSALSSERRYVIRVLPRAVLRGIAAPGHGGLAAAAAILAVLAVTVAGYATQSVGGALRRPLVAVSRRASAVGGERP